MGESSTESTGSKTRGALLASPTDDRRSFAALSSPFAHANPTDVIILINRAEIAGFKHFADAMQATLLPKKPVIEAVHHPLGGFTHAVPQGTGSFRIYRGWWSTMAKAVAALPKDSAFSHLNPKTK